jgi:Transcriptional Coactivator p15 (PC4)
VTHFTRRPGEERERVECAPSGDTVQIAEFPRDERFKLKLQVRTFNGGARYVDLRLHERADDGSSIPTVRGLTLRPSELEQVVAALERARHILRPHADREAGK